MNAVSDEEIQGAARGMIEQHGPDASREAAIRLGDVMAVRDAKLIAWWRRVTDALNRIEGKK